MNESQNEFYNATALGRKLARCDHDPPCKDGCKDNGGSFHLDDMFPPCIPEDLGPPFQQMMTEYLHCFRIDSKDECKRSRHCQWHEDEQRKWCTGLEHPRLVLAGCEAINATAPTATSLPFFNFTLYVKDDPGVTSVAFSLDSKFLAIGSNEGEYDVTGVGIYDLEARTRNATFGEFGSTTSLAFSPDSKLLAAADSSNLVVFWNVESKTQSYVLHAAYSVAFSPDAKFFAAGDDHGQTFVYELTDGEAPSLNRTFQMHDERYGTVYAVAFSPDSKLLASGFGVDDNGDYMSEPRYTILIYDLVNGVLKYTLDDVTSDVMSLAFSPDSKFLASGSWDSGAQVYELRDGLAPSLKYTLPETVYSVAFSPDSKLLATGSFDKLVRIYELGDGEAPSLKYALDDAAGRIWSVAFSPDSKLLAAGSSDATARVYRLPPEDGDGGVEDSVIV